MNSWERQPGEPNRWYRRFERFLRMGPNRSLFGCFKEERSETVREGMKKYASGNAPGSWIRAAEQWDWRNRADDYDEHLSAEISQKWEQRYKEFREREWAILERVVEKLEKMLEFPVAAVTREEKASDGRVIAVTTINPARWTMRDIAAILEAMSKIAAERSDAKEPPPPGQVMVFDLSKLPVEILRAIANEPEPSTTEDGGKAGTGTK